MNKPIIFQLILYIVVIGGAVSGLLTILRAGQVILGMGIIDLILGIAALLRMPILRGDVSTLNPLGIGDMGEGGDGHDLENVRPSTRLWLPMLFIGIVGIIVGLVMILLVA